MGTPSGSTTPPSGCAALDAPWLLLAGAAEEEGRTLEVEEDAAALAADDGAGMLDAVTALVLDVPVEVAVVDDASDELAGEEDAMPDDATEELPVVWALDVPPDEELLLPSSGP